MWPQSKTSAAVVFVFSFLSTVTAHPHDDKIDEEALNAPIDSILYIHIGLQALLWGVIFPTGMVLGIVRSRWHVPVQTAALVLTAGGYLLGHKHGGRKFPESLHEIASNIIMVPLLIQAVLGVYLKLHIHEKSIRPWAVLAHGIVGKAFPIIGWCQMLFGAIVIGGYCNGGALGQCLAHYIMGSAFIGYGIILAILLLVGQPWLRRRGRSNEWWDSWVIFVWGIVNTFTEHHGGPWTHKDLQHTSLGIVWVAGGALGIILSLRKSRNVIPALMLILTGWAMSSHAQAFKYSEMIHSIFGWTLMTAGLARIIDVCFVSPRYEESNADSDETPTLNPFQHLTPFLLVAAGLLFMSATDEELHYVDNLGLDHVTYVLIMFSIAFIIYSLANILLNSYSSATHTNKTTDSELPRGEGNKYYHRVPDTASLFSGYTLGPHVLHDEEVYELAGPDNDEDPFDDEHHNQRPSRS